MSSDIYKLGKFTIYGFGAQGKAWAQNLRDSGLDVTVHLREDSKRLDEARALGLKVTTDPAQAAKLCDFACLMIPDAIHGSFHQEFLEANLRPNSAVVFAHGMAVHSGILKMRGDIDYLLVAPLAHGDAVRSEYLSGGSVACMLATAREGDKASFDRALTCAKAISKDGPFIESSFREEVEMDLFIEQSLLCGGLTELVKATFNVLVSAGYNKLAAYHSCVREIRPIVNLLEKFGPAGLLTKVSDAAAYGALTRGPTIVGESVTSEMTAALKYIQNGEFTKEFLADAKAGGKITKSLLELAHEDEMQVTHDEVVKAR